MTAPGKSSAPPPSLSKGGNTLPVSPLPNVVRVRSPRFSAPAPPVIKTTLKTFPRERFLNWLKDLKINTKDFGLVPLKMLGTQLYVLDEICKGLAEGISTFVILKARQLGMSTFFIALDLFWAMEYPGLTGTFATHTDQSKAQFRQIIKTFFRHLPKTHKIATEIENRDMLILKNDSMFLYLVAGVKEKTTSHMGRSGASNFLHATEAAFWGSPEDKKELAATLSAHYPHRLEIYESTANGFNHFYDQWEQAKESPTQRTIFVGWWRNELYAFGETHPWFLHYMPKGQDSSLTMLERSRRSDVKRLYDFEVSKEQIAWYRWYLAEQADGDQQKMDEQFPWVEEDAFVASGARFFTNESLTDAFKRTRQVPCKPYKYHLSTRWLDTQLEGLKDAKRATLKIYADPDPTGEYVFGCDPAYGSSDAADRNCIHIARAFSDRLVQVAEFCSAECAAYQTAWVLAHLAGWYRNCNINLEITGPGTNVWDELMRLRIDVLSQRLPANVDEADRSLRNVLMNIRTYMWRRPDTPGTLANHWRTSHESKKIAMYALRDNFELGRHLINSIQCLEEMKGVVNDDGYIGADGRAKDDRVMAAALASIYWQQWVQPRMKAQGLSYEKVMQNAVTGGPTVAEAAAINYLRRMRVLLPGQNLGGNNGKTRA